ncbi:MAG: extracellular solute-binding protein [Treponema sp.]|jgi:putative aldouronate transport system substrate-binding protein|nr:extracellular solute-binding protein [Treponema sp.]
MKKLAIAFLAIIVIGGCSRKAVDAPAASSGQTARTVSADEPGWKANASTPIKFQWYINFSWFSRQWGQSKVSKYITQKTGVDVEFIVPAGNEAERLNAMIAGNTLPDLLTLGWWEGQVGMMIDAGLVEPLNVLAEQYDPYFFKVADKDKLGWYTRSDGNVYGYPNASYTPSDYEKYQGKLTANETFLVRKDMWEALGKPDMTTPEGFLAALRAAKEQFPTVNGQSLIPLSFQEFTDSGNTALQPYLLHFLNIKPEKNGVYESLDLGINDPEYIRWLKTFRQAAEEGLIPMDVFVDKRSQIEEKAAQGRYFCMMYQNWDMQAPQNALYARDPNMIYIAIDGPKNSRNDPPALAGGGISGWTITLISKNCKDKARAIQFLSYLISEEGQMDVFFGIPDDTYTIVDGVPTFVPSVKEVNLTDKNKQEIEIGVDYTYWMLMDTAWQGQWPAEYAPSLGQPQLWTRPYVTSYAQYDNLEMQPGSDAALISDEIQRRWGRDLPRLILAKTEAEFDSIWNEFQTFKTGRGYAKLQEEQTKLLVANKNKLGIQ